MYRVRLTEAGQDRHQYRDVQPANTRMFTVTGLQASTDYMATVMAYSRLGDSAYTQPVRLRTAGQSRLQHAAPELRSRHDTRIVTER